MDKDKFERKITSYIKESGFSQAEIARKIQVHPSTLTKWIKGYKARKIPYEALQRICQIIGPLIKNWDDDKQAELFKLAAYADQLPKARSAPVQLPPSVPFFVGREDDLNQLLADLQPGRVVTLCGPGGIGKTALVTEALRKLAPKGQPPKLFPDGIIFHSFYNQPEAALALEKIARDLGEDIRPTPRDAAQRALTGKRVLLVLDGAENSDDLETVLSVAGSCGVIVTSRRHSIPIPQWKDVPPLPLEAAETLFQQWSRAQGPDKVAIQRICQLVGGLPLAIRLAGSYLAQTKQSAGDYLAWLEETPLQALDHGRRQYESIPALLKKSIDRLSEATQQALAVVGLLALAPFQPEVIAQAMGISKTKENIHLGELVDYSLLERTSQGYEVSHALIHTYCREQMDVASEAEERVTAFYIEMAVKLSQLGLEGYTKLNSERAHLMAVLAGCVKRKDWNVAYNLAATIEEYLDLQGHWTERGIANKTALAAARALNNRQAEGVWLGNLGLAYSDLGQYERAIEYYEQALTIAREIGDRYNEGTWLGDLGLAYRYLSQIAKAINCYQQALTIAREIGDRRGEGNDIANLGLAYSDLGQYERAIECYEQALTIAREIGDRRGESNRLRNLGTIYRRLGHIEQAIEHSQQALTIAREIGDRRGEGGDIGNLGTAYHTIGQTERAIEHFQQALTIAREIGDRRSEGVYLGNLGSVAYGAGQGERAIEHFQEAVVIAREIGDRYHEGFWLGNLGLAYSDLGQYERAIECYEQALTIAREIGDRRNEQAWLSELGSAYDTIGQMEQALEHSQQALTIAREIGDRHIEQVILGDLGRIYHATGQMGTARQYLVQALNTYDAIESPDTTRLRELLAIIDSDGTTHLAHP